MVGCPRGYAAVAQDFLGAAGAAAGAGSAGACARTGVLAIRTATPAIARRVFVFLLFSIVRQFLLDLTRGTKGAAIVSDRPPT